MADITFKINTTDLSAYEDKEKHDVNRNDVFETWTDGNWVEHRVIARTRVEGSVFLKFSRQAAFDSFLSLLSSARNANGYYPITVWCSNTGSSVTINAFLAYSGQTKWDVTCPRKWQGGTVTIRER